MKKAFTLVELIMVIVILAIISAFGAELYTKIYRSYAHSRAINNLEDKTNIALARISALLQDRIRGTEIVRTAGTAGFVSLMQTNPNHDVIEWIGQSTQTKYIADNTNPGIASQRAAGWSGFMDISTLVPPAGAGAGGTNQLVANANVVSQGSRIDAVQRTINNIYNGAGADTNFGLIFYFRPEITNVATDFGYDGTTSSKVAMVRHVSGTNSDIINVVTPNTGGNISNMYYISHSAYALVPDNIQDVNYDGTANYGRNFNLVLKYNYRPWNNEQYMNGNHATAEQAGNTSTIAENVAVFRFTYDESSGGVALKLCLRDGGANFDPNELDLVICKSQVVR